MANPSLKIAGIELSVVAHLTFDQRLEAFGGSTVRRMANGAAFKLTHWRKYRISLSASGWIPPALNAIDYAAPFEVELPMPLAFNTGEALPAGFTARLAPNGEHTVTDQAGQSVRYVYVKTTVIAEPASQTNGSSSNPSWELTMEQV